MSLTIKIRFIAGVFLLLSAALMWWWVLWPVKYTEQTITLPSVVPTDTQFAAAAGAVNKNSLQVTLSYPARLHTGERGAIHARLAGSASQAQLTALPADTRVLVEERVVLPPLQVDPPESVQSTFSTLHLPGFFWQVITPAEGVFSGQFWLYLVFVAPDGSMERQALLSVPLTVEVNHCLGLPENVMTWIASAITFLGLVIFPIVLLLRHKTSK